MDGLFPTEAATRAPARGRLAALRASPLAHGLILGGFALATALILSLSDTFTRDPIAARATEDLLASLDQVLPPELYTNDPAATLREIDDPVEGVLPVHIGAKAGQVTGVALELTGYGYGGAIRVLIGIDPNGEILGARVLAHAETPGLGDKIEAAKSFWIENFTGKSLSNTADESWKVSKDGGTFDQFSGATITPRAVVATVHRGLTLFARNRDALLAPMETTP
ncbi:MAG: electron transport complex subunit RsxG [Maritimibacter sp.]|nr:electron transport complex subunit RsxG [Maritimibacter sp.]